MKLPGARQVALYGDDYTPMHYDREFRLHDERQDALYRQRLLD